MPEPEHFRIAARSHGGSHAAGHVSKHKRQSAITAATGLARLAEQEAEALSTSPSRAHAVSHSVAVRPAGGPLQHRGEVARSASAASRITRQGTWQVSWQEMGATEPGAKLSGAPMQPYVRTGWAAVFQKKQLSAGLRPAASR